MSFHSLKQSLIYLMHDHRILHDIFFGSRQLRAKVLSNSWLQAKPVNPKYYFWQISGKSPGFYVRHIYAISLKFISLSLRTNYPCVALTCSSLSFSSYLHSWALCFFVAGFLTSLKWLAELSVLHAFYLVQVIRVADICVAWLVYLACLCSNVLHAYCKFESQQAISITLFRRRSNKGIRKLENISQSHIWPIQLNKVRVFLGSLVWRCLNTVSLQMLSLFTVN